MAEFVALLKNFIGLLREFKDSKFLKSSKGMLLFLIGIMIILGLILALIKNPSLLQNLFHDEKDDLENLFHDEKDDLVSHCKPFYLSKYNNIGELKKVLRSEAKRKEAQKFFDNNLRHKINNHTSEKEDQIIKLLERYVVLEKEEYTNNPDELGGSCISFKPSNKLEDKINPKKFQEEYCASDRNAPLAKIQEEKDKVIIHCKPFYQSKYNNIGELKKVLRSEAKRKEAQKFFDNNLRHRISNYTSEKEDHIIKILERYVVLEKEEYTNSPDELGGSCISFKPSNKLEDKINPKKFQEEYCASDRNAPLAKIQEEKDKVIITELREYEPKLQQLAGKKILNLLLEKPIFEEDLKGRKHCGIIKFSILPLQLKAILIEDEFNTIPKVKGVDKNDNKAEFKFIILSDKYNWDYESDDQIELTGEGANISELLSGEDMILNFGETFGIISVGTASCEGVKSSENKRAEKRAVTLDQWFNQAFITHDDLNNTERYTLNLGQYKRKCLSKTEKTEQQTALQRRVIIISITDRDKDVNLSQALRDAIIKRQDLSFDIKNYSSFDLKRSN